VAQMDDIKVCCDQIRQLLQAEPLVEAGDAKYRVRIVAKSLPAGFPLEIVRVPNDGSPPSGFGFYVHNCPFCGRPLGLWTDEALKLAKLELDKKMGQHI